MRNIDTSIKADTIAFRLRFPKLFVVVLPIRIDGLLVKDGARSMEH